ncbi:MAG: hypothetical protein LCI00_15610 [Chloroflexi bacterium]|nr:hypothetical protein [Chloroflexota bacterium]
MVREIGRRTRLRNRDVQWMLDTLIELWTETLASDERIELENLFVLETQRIDRGEWVGVLNGKPAPRIIRQITVRASKRLKLVLKQVDQPTD